jgi:hypothetical protein
MFIVQQAKEKEIQVSMYKNPFSNQKSNKNNPTG